jgi:hypothetical protein
VINRFALPVFLFHTTGMALYRGINYVVFGNRTDVREPDLLWWLTRPLAFIGPRAAGLVSRSMWKSRLRSSSSSRSGR